LPSSPTPRISRMLIHVPCALYLFRLDQATLRMVTPPSSPTLTPVPASTAASARSLPPLVPLLGLPFILFYFKLYFIRFFNSHYLLATKAFCTTQAAWLPTAMRLPA
jgi:hypothetical protein